MKAKFAGRCIRCGEAFWRGEDIDPIPPVPGDDQWQHVHVACPAERPAPRPAPPPKTRRDAADLYDEAVCDRCGASYTARRGHLPERCPQLAVLRGTRFSPAKCPRCDRWFGARPHPGRPRCPDPGHEGLRPPTATGPGGTCGGRLVPDSEPEPTAGPSLPCVDCGRPSGAEPLNELSDDTPGWLRRAFERYRPVCKECALTAPASDAREATTSDQDADEQLALEGTGERARSQSGGPLRSLAPRAGLGDDVSPAPAGEVDVRGGARPQPNAPGGEEEEA